MSDDRADATVVDTAAGPIECAERGVGDPILFVHGSPGGWDQGVVMTSFLADAGFRVVTPSRPGYLGTPLTDGTVGPDQQSDLELALMDALGIDRFGLMCWSGGGPSSYRLAGKAPERVTALVAIAAVSGAYTFATGAEASLMAGRFGHWLIGELARHAPKSLIKSTIGEEGDLSKAQLKALTEEIWADETKRAFVIGLAGTVAGRTEGLHNDQTWFPQITDLGLAKVQAPTLLIHGTVDTDVPPEQSDRALAAIAGAEILRVDGGTHIAAWTDPTSDAIQAQIAAALRPG